VDEGHQVSYFDLTFLVDEQTALNNLWLPWCNLTALHTSNRIFLFDHKVGSVVFVLDLKEETPICCAFYDIQSKQWISIILY
jgi:hypothetical protein